MNESEAPHTGELPGIGPDTQAMIVYSLWRADQWPPVLQPATLLVDAPDLTAPRDQWDVDKWKAYAELLERSGAEWVKRAKRAEAEARELQSRLARKPARSFLAWTAPWWMPPAKRKRGRPVGAFSADHAMYSRALALWDSNPRAGRKVALIAAYLEANLDAPKYRAEAWATPGRAAELSRMRRKKSAS